MSIQHFADDIDGLAGKEEEIENLVKTVETTSTAYGMKIISETQKSCQIKLMASQKY